MVYVTFLLFLDVFGHKILSAGTEDVDEVLLHVPVADGVVAHLIVSTLSTAGRQSSGLSFTC